jgi:hypothetical protein
MKVGERNMAANKPEVEAGRKSTDDLRRAAELLERFSDTTLVYEPGTGRAELRGIASRLLAMATAPDNKELIAEAREFIEDYCLPLKPGMFPDIIDRLCTALESAPKAEPELTRYAMAQLNWLRSSAAEALSDARRVTAFIVAANELLAATPRYAAAPINRPTAYSPPDPEDKT